METEETKKRKERRKPDDYEIACAERARAIAEKSPLAVRGTKEAILYTRDHSVADSLNQIATWNASMLSVADVMTAIQAQMEGKQAEFDD